MKEKFENRVYKGWIINPLTTVTMHGEKIQLYKAMKNKAGICGVLEEIKAEIDSIEEGKSGRKN